jgi:hypothetical protein
MELQSLLWKALIRGENFTRSSSDFSTNLQSNADFALQVSSLQQKRYMTKTNPQLKTRFEQGSLGICVAARATTQ